MYFLLIVRAQKPAQTARRAPRRRSQARHKTNLDAAPSALRLAQESSRSAGAITLAAASPNTLQPTSAPGAKAVLLSKTLQMSLWARFCAMADIKLAEHEDRICACSLPCPGGRPPPTVCPTAT